MKSVLERVDTVVLTANPAAPVPGRPDGASVGGIVALYAATSITPVVDAVVDQSGKLSWSGLESMAAA